MRMFRVSHQSLCINKIDFENNWVCGYTDIIVWPLDQSMTTIYLNAKQIRIHSTKLVTLQNDISIVHTDLAMSYHDPFMAVSKRSDYNYFNLDNFIKLHTSSAKRVDLDEGIGELNLQIPREFSSYVAELKPLKLTVEFSLYKPKAGLYFVKPPKLYNAVNDTGDGGVHLYTYIQGNMSRLWFPCVDSSEPCTWKIEITVQEEMTAISSGVLLDTVYTPDLHAKVYHYYLKQPVPAFNIGLVVGDFEIYPDPKIPKFIHFCLPKMMPLLKNTVDSFPNIFKFIEEKLNFNYPFDTYKTVFVDSAIQDYASFASMTIFSTYLLHPPTMLDQALETIRTFALAVPEQFFGQFTVMRSWPDIWVPWGIAGYLGRLYIKKLMGSSEYKFLIHREMMEVVGYEEQNGGIVLDPKACLNPPNYSFSLELAQASNYRYMTMYKKKAALIVRLLEIKLGPVLVLKVFRKLLHLALKAQDTVIDPNCNLAQPIEDKSNLLLCSDLLVYAVDLVSGLQINNFLTQWVNKPGHVRLQAEYIFNRRKNVIELYIKQLFGRFRGCSEYLGPIEVGVQEYEGYYRHKIRLERPNCSSAGANTQPRFTQDISLHTKVRKHRRRKVTLATGVEVDIDLPNTTGGGGQTSNTPMSGDPTGTGGSMLSSVEADIPYLWLIIDPKMSLFGKIDVCHTSRSAICIIKFDSEPLSQAKAIIELTSKSDICNMPILREVILSPRFFCHVRIQAAIGMRDLMNMTSHVNQGGLREALTALCFTKTDKSLVKCNDFRNFSHYMLQISLIRQLALLQTSHGLCPSDVHQILNGLLLYNENSSNRYSDHHYKAEILMAMADAIRLGIFHRSSDATLECMPTEVRIILKDVLRCLTLDQTVPSFNFVITQPCLLILRRLQQFGYIVDDPTIFYPYVTDNNVPAVRSVAIFCLLNSLDGLKNYQVVEWLMINVLLNDNFSPSSIRLNALNYLTDKIRGCNTGGVGSGYSNIASLTNGQGGLMNAGPWNISGNIGGNQQTGSNHGHDMLRSYWSQLLLQLHRYMECQAAHDWAIRGAVLQLVRAISEIGMSGNNVSGHLSTSNTCFYDDGYYSNYQQIYHLHNHLSTSMTNVSNTNLTTNMLSSIGAPVNVGMVSNSPNVIGRANIQSNDMGRLSDDSDDEMN